MHCRNKNRWCIDRSLNALTPIFVIITGALFFKSSTSKQKINGVIIGLVGCALLTYANYTKPVAYIAYIGLVILATFFYGLNVNVVQRKLHGIGSTAIAAVAFVGLLPFALVILFYTGYFNLPLSENKYFISTLSSSVLGILGTAIDDIILYVGKTCGWVVCIFGYIWCAICCHCLGVFL